MTFPSARSPRLIAVASFSLVPVARVRFWRSEPAKSTRHIFAETTVVGVVVSEESESPFSFAFPLLFLLLITRLLPRCSRVSVTIACDLEEAAFTAVAPVARLLPAEESREASC